MLYQWLFLNGGKDQDQAISIWNKLYMTTTVAEDKSQPWRTSLKCQMWIIRKTREHRRYTDGKIMNELTKTWTSRNGKQIDIVWPWEYVWSSGPSVRFYEIPCNMDLYSVQDFVACLCSLGFLSLAWPIFLLSFKFKSCFLLYPEPQSSGPSSICHDACYRCLP